MLVSSQEIYESECGHRVMPQGGTIKRVLGKSIVNQQTEDGQRITFTHDGVYGAWMTSEENYCRAPNLAIRKHVRGGGTTLRPQNSPIEDDKTVILDSETSGDLLVLLCPHGSKAPDYLDLTGTTNIDDTYLLTSAHARASYGFGDVFDSPLDACNGTMYRNAVELDGNKLKINTVVSSGPYMYKPSMDEKKVGVVGNGAWKVLDPQIFAYRYGERMFTTVKQFNAY